MNGRQKLPSLYWWAGSLYVLLIVAPRASGQQPQLRYTLTGHTGTITALAFSDDGKMLATGSEDFTIKLWNLADGKCRITLSGHSNVVRGVVFEPDGRRLVSASKDKTIKRWEVATGKCYATFEPDGRQVQAVALSKDGKILASGTAEVQLWNASNGKRIGLLDQGGGVHSLAFSSDGKTLAAGGARIRDANPCSIKLWDVASGKETRTMVNHYQYADCVVLSPDGKVLASAGGSTGPAGGMGVLDLYLCEVATGKKLFGSERVGGVFAAFSPDGKTLATAAGRSTSKARQTPFTLTSEIQQPAAKQPPPGTIMLWDVENRKPALSFQGHDKFAVCGAFSPDGKLLATGSQDKTIKLWEMPAPKAK